MKRLLLVLAAALMGTISAAAQESPSPQDLAGRAIERRAVEAVIWGMPVVNYDLMLQEMLTKTAGKENQMIYWGRPLDWHNQTLTPNPDTLYLMSFLDTKDVGPIVIEIPPASADGSLNANIVNVWQVPLEDAGLLGVDKGKGVKLLMLPPGYSGQIPDGYHALQPNTNGSYVLFRSNMKSHNDADVAKSAAYAKQIKIYPLSQASSPPATVFTDVQNVLFDSTIRYDDSFFVHLNRIVQSEPWFDRDRAMIDQLKSLGIEKGKPFAPNATTKEALSAGVREAHSLLEARYNAGLPPFFEGTHWTFPAHPDLIKGAAENFDNPENYPVDWRGLTYSYAYIGIKRLGAGQFYLINIKDKDGNSYEGANTYRLRVPANVPIEQYWSLTAYDRDTHALIKNVDRASRASNAAEVKKNADGSVDLYLGPKAPAGQESNWIPTDPARKFELMFRLYGPKKEFFEKTWALPDVERIGMETAQAKQDSIAVPVTVDNFARAESDLYMGNAEKDGGFGKFHHNREPTPIDKQLVIRMNRDTLYSMAVFDLDAGPVTITLPDAGKRFMSLQIIDEDHYVPMVVYAPSEVTLSKESVGTRYVAAAVRTLVDPSNSSDLDQVHSLQDAIKIDQKSAGTFDVPRWDQVAQKKIRDSLLSLAEFTGGFKNAFGTKDEVDPVRHLIATAAGWGGNPDKDATYLSFAPAKNDGTTVYKLHVPETVPVDAFWSISLYDAQGYFEKNKYNAYSLNDITGTKNADGSVDVQFGGCDGKIPNCLPIMNGWNYTVRLYRPRPEILKGAWKFPEPQPVSSGAAVGASSGTGKE